MEIPMLYQQTNPHGGDIYRHKIRLDYSANLNPLGTPPAVKEAIRKSSEWVSQYPDPYCEELRRTIAQKEHLPVEYVFCGNGAADLIYSFAAATKPRKVLIVAPTFCEYAQSLRQHGTEIIYYMLKEENEFSLTEDIIEQLKNEYDTLYLCNPNNPTGKCVTPTVLEQILVRCKELKIRLFIDECFLEWVEGVESFTKYCSEYPNLFILKAFTKSYGMAGVRLGYGLCSDSEMFHHMSETSQTWNVSTCAQLAGIAACGCEEFFQKAKEKVAIERNRLRIALEQEGIQVFQGEANFLLLKSEQNLCEALLEQGIMIRDCSNFYGLSKGYYRIAVKLEEENNLLLAAIGNARHQNQRLQNP